MLLSYVQVNDESLKYNPLYLEWCKYCQLSLFFIVYPFPDCWIIHSAPAGGFSVVDNVAFSMLPFIPASALLPSPVPVANIYFSPDVNVVDDSYVTSASIVCEPVTVLEPCIVESMFPVNTIMLFSLSVLSCELLYKYSYALLHEPNGVSGDNPSFKLSFPPSEFKYTTVAVFQFAYMFSVTFFEPVAVIVCVFVFVSVDIIPSGDVHPPNPYPVGLSINGLSTNSIDMFPLTIGAVFLYVTILYFSVNDTYPIFSGSTSFNPYP